MSQTFVPRIYSRASRFSFFGVQVEGQVSRDQITQLLTRGRWGCTAADNVENQIFVFHLPQYAKDYAGGGVCQATGYWGASSGMVTVDGARFLRDFAPERVTKPGP